MRPNAITTDYTVLRFGPTEKEIRTRGDALTSQTAVVVVVAAAIDAITPARIPAISFRHSWAMFDNLLIQYTLCARRRVMVSAHSVAC